MFQSFMVLTLATSEDREKEMHDEVGINRKAISLIQKCRDYFLPQNAGLECFSEEETLAPCTGRAVGGRLII